MPISKLTGPMLSNVLVRDGQGVTFTDTANSTPLLYLDIANSRVGVNTDAPTTDFTINGAGFACSLNLTNNISLGGNVIADGDVIVVNVSASGNINTVNFEASGDANAVNISASGNINAFANIVSGNVNTVNLSATGFANAVNISASGNINAFANIFAGNVNANTLTSTNNLSVSGTANISSLTVTNISVSGNITGNVTTSTTGNITAGNLDVTGTAILGNIVISDTTISSVGNVVIFAGTEGIAVPVGNIAQRPGNVPAGTLRFNSENDSLETWDGTDWINTSAQPSTIFDQQITGNDGTTYALTYSVIDNNNIIVTINGLTQRPGIAYNIVGSNIVFANPLLTSEVADIRYLTYPVGVPDYGNANVAAYLSTNTGNIAAGNIFTDNYLYANGTPVNFGGGSNYANSNVAAYAEAGWAGNIIPSANGVYSLGNSTSYWSNIWVASNTIYIGGVPVGVSGNSLTVNGDTVLSANTSSSISTTGNVNAEFVRVTGGLVSQGASPAPYISGFTSISTITSSNPNEGNITAGRNLIANVAVISQGNITAVGNVSANYFIGDGSQLTGITANSLVSGNSGVEFAGPGANIELTVGGVGIADISSNTFGVNGNVTANYFIGDGSQLTNLPGGGGLPIANGTSNINIATANGNITITANGTASWTFATTGALTVPGSIVSPDTLSVTAEDDINILGGNKVPGSDSREGGDINIRGGAGRIDNGSTTGSGGDVEILGGLGGDGVSSVAGQGGGIVIEAGPGGNANIANAVQAGEGGQILIQGGNGGDNAGNNALSGIGGNVDIYGGSGSFDQANTIPNGAPGHINLYGGNWGYNFAPTGNIYLNTYDGVNFKTLTYDYNGNVTMAAGGGLNFIGSNPGIVQSPDEDFRILVQDADDDGFSVQQQVDDGAGTLLGSTQLQRDRYLIEFSGGTAPQFRFTQEGQIEIPGNIRAAEYVDTSLYAVSDNSENGSVELKVISYIGDVLGSNVRVTQSNAYISTSNAAHTWIFDNTGNLTLPLSGNLVGVTANNNGFINWLGNSSGDNNGYTTLALVPDDTLVNNDQYLILDPTAPGHIHIRAGGTQDNSSADLILGGENSHFKVAGGANSDVFVRSNSNQWEFGTTGILRLPGEGVLQSFDDTVTLSSLNTTTGNANSVYLGSGGGLGFNDGEIGGNWLEIFRNGAEPEIRTQVGNITIQTVSNSTPYNWNFNSNGTLSAPGDISLVGTVSANSVASGNVTATTAFTLPVYADDTARDAAIVSPTAGMLIFNTAAANFQGYNGTSWGNITLS